TVLTRKQSEQSRSRSIIGERRGSDLTGAAWVQTVTLAGSLIRGEEEKLVFHDRAAEIETKLILFELRPGLPRIVAEESVGIQRIVAEEFPQSAMELVRTGLSHHIYVGACIAPVRCIILPGLHLEFFDGIRIGDGHAAAEKSAALQIVNADTVH